MMPTLFQVMMPQVRKMSFAGAFIPDTGVQSPDTGVQSADTGVQSRDSFSENVLPEYDVIVWQIELT
jgi:hypothetical protein